MEFPITWEGDEASRFWFWDQSHWPRPTTPLAATLELPAMAEGFTRACRLMQRPFPAYHVKVVNGFVYFGFDLVTDPAERAARTAAHAAALAPRIPDVTRFWSEDVLPEVLAGNERMRFTDWDAMSGTELAAALDELYALRARQWELHDLVLVPTMAALDAFLTLYARWFPDAPPVDAHALLRGLPNKTVEAARALWRLAQESRPHPRLGPYLDEYGWRTDGWELSDPALREEPGPLLARLRRYMESDHPDPEIELAHAAEERERLTAQALARLPDEAAREEFTAALSAARSYPALSEDHNFYIDQMGLTAVRVPLLAMGRRLVAAGLLEQPDDVFYLTRDELREDLADLTPRPPSLKGRGRPIGAPLGTNRAKASDSPFPLGKGVRGLGLRRAERARWWNERPPATIGIPLPADMANDPLYAGFFGIGADPDAGGRVLRGVGGAPGVAAGPARIARSLAEAERLAPGDILVCPMTSPAWTPLFATAAAVVADAGGVLSHTAIVAREYGIPCVVATRIACRDLTDGEWIEVDGTTGEVRRLGR
jgi:phosphohistidine swiveling domain-containing protein